MALNASKVPAGDVRVPYPCPTPKPALAPMYQPVHENGAATGPGAGTRGCALTARSAPRAGVTPGATPSAALKATGAPSANSHAPAASKLRLPRFIANSACKSRLTDFSISHDGAMQSVT